MNSNNGWGGAREGGGRRARYGQAMTQRGISLADQHLDAIEAWRDDIGPEDASDAEIVRAMIEHAERWRSRAVGKRRR